MQEVLHGVPDRGRRSQMSYSPPVALERPPTAGSTTSRPELGTRKLVTETPHGPSVGTADASLPASEIAEPRMSRRLPFGLHRRGSSIPSVTIDRGSTSVCRTGVRTGRAFWVKRIEWNLPLPSKADPIPDRIKIKACIVRSKVQLIGTQVWTLTISPAWSPVTHYILFGVPALAMGDGGYSPGGETGPWL